MSAAVRAASAFRVAAACAAASLALPSVPGLAEEPAGSPEGEEPLVEELVVVGRRIPLNREERMRVYEELAKARRLYDRRLIEEAMPHLLSTARHGFKSSQATVGHIYLQGLGEVDADPVRGVGWLGVASSGTTSPKIRNYFKDMWKRIPERHVGYFEEVVEEYRERYGEVATGVVCELNRPVRSYVKHLECFFEQDLPDLVRETLDDMRSEGEAVERYNQAMERVRESIRTRQQQQP